MIFSLRLQFGIENYLATFDLFLMRTESVFPTTPSHTPPHSQLLTHSLVVNEKTLRDLILSCAPPTKKVQSRTSSLLLPSERGGKAAPPNKGRGGKNTTTQKEEERCRLLVVLPLLLLWSGAAVRILLLGGAPLSSSFLGSAVVPASPLFWVVLFHSILSQGGAVFLVFLWVVLQKE